MVKLDQLITCIYLLFPGNFERGVKDLFYFFPFNVNLQNSSGAYNPEVSLTATNTECSFFHKQTKTTSRKIIDQCKFLSADPFYIKTYFLIFCFQLYEVLRATFWREVGFLYDIRQLHGMGFGSAILFLLICNTFAVFFGMCLKKAAHKAILRKYI